MASKPVNDKNAAQSFVHKDDIARNRLLANGPGALLAAFLAAFATIFIKDPIIDYCHRHSIHATFSFWLDFIILFIIIGMILRFRHLYSQTVSACRAASWHCVVALRWLGYVWYGPSSQCSRMRSSIARQYFDEEIRDITGVADFCSRSPENEALTRKAFKGLDEKTKDAMPRDVDARAIVSIRKLLKIKDDGAHPWEPRPVIVTNFVRYSQLVRAAVDEALALKDRKSYVVCFTTLSMPIQKWFNFNTRIDGSNPLWDRYLDFVRGLSKEHGVVLARMLLLHAGKQDPTQHIRLQSKNELQQELKRWIWVSSKATKRYPMPLTSEAPERQRERLNADLVTWPAPQKYVITDSVPQGGYEIINETDSAVKGYRPLVDEFIMKFHTLKRGSNPDMLNSYHSYYAEVDYSKYHTSHGERHMPPLPVDLFYIGIAKPKDKEDISSLEIDVLLERTEPLFCLSAKTDEDLEMVHLHLLDPMRCPVSIDIIQEYIKGYLMERKQSTSSVNSAASAESELS